MQKMKLTDKLVESLPLALKGERYEVADSIDGKMRLRIGTRRKTFICVARFGGSDHPTRRKMGDYPNIRTADARKIVSEWEGLIEARIDPKAEAERAEAEKVLRRRHTFRSVMEDYIAFIPSREFNRAVAAEIKRIRANILNPNVNPWIEKPVYEVTDVDVASLIESIRMRPAPTEAYCTFSIMRTFFNWAISPARRTHFGLTLNPIAGLTHKKLGLRARQRDRVFDQSEARAYLSAAALTPYPYGSFAMALILTGQRLMDVAGMRWSELKLEQKLWEIPEQRYKTGRNHMVPLSDAMVLLLAELERHMPEEHGDFVFSTTNGRTHINGFSKAKDAFDKLMVAAIEEDNPLAMIKSWTWHDVRRTVRTQFEAFANKSEIAEAAIGHGKKGIQRVYNLYKYRREIRIGFNAFADLLGKARSRTLDPDEW